MVCLGYTDHEHIEAMMVHIVASSCYSDHWGRGPADLPGPLAPTPRLFRQILASRRTGVDQAFYRSRLGVV